MNKMNDNPHVNYNGGIATNDILFSASSSQDFSKSELDDSHNSSVEKILVNDLPVEQKSANIQAILNSNSPVKYQAIKSTSCSRPNFCWKLAQKFYSKSDLVNCNCRGFNKPSLDPSILAKIRKLAFEWYPLVKGESEFKCWRECEKAIDKGGRAIKFSAKLIKKQ